MCGITFCIKGIDISKLQFYFDLFQLYRENPFNTFTLSQPGNNFLTYIQEKQLYINDFSPQHILESISNRGPDAFHCYKILIPHENSNKPYVEEIKPNDKAFTSNIFSSNNEEVNNNSPAFEIYAACSVLHLRGEYNHPTPQPLFDSNTNNFLLYNGEIFNIERNYTDKLSKKEGEYKEVFEHIQKFNPYENDTKQLLDILNTYSLTYNKTTNAGLSMNYIEDVRDIVNCFNADFSFVYVDILNRKISFGKDIFGKRGLVLGLHKQGFCISSCSINTNVSEADLQDNADEGEEEGRPEKAASKKEEELKNHSGLVKEHLKQEFLEKKYNNEYFAALDKTWVEVPANKVISADIKIDKTLDPAVQFSFREIGLSYLRNLFSLQKEGIVTFEEDTIIATNQVTEYLRKSLTNILRNIIAYKTYFEEKDPDYVASEEEKKEEGKQDENTTDQKTNSQLAILFSGGLDSTLLALLCSQILPKGAR